MGKLVIVVLVLLIFVLASCSKGNVITGQVVVDTKDDAPVKKVKDVKVSDQPEDDSSDDDKSESQEDESGSEAEEPREALLDDAEVPDYSSSAGTCTVDGSGVVRTIDEDGLKTVYRNDCFGDKLVRYGCESNEMTTELENCDKGCMIVNYEGRCA